MLPGDVQQPSGPGPVAIASAILAILLTTTWAAAQPTYQLSVLASDLDKPVSVTVDPRGRILVSTLDGVVLLFEGGSVRPAPVLSLAGRVTALEGEQGFYTAAVQPQSDGDGSAWLFAAYTEVGTGDLLVSRFAYDVDRALADATSEQVVLRVPMPEPFHFGGQVRFGPDGMLWVGVGNGERSNRFLHERPFSSQDLSELRGKLLRLDVTATEGEPYRTPPDNPFVGVDGARPEVYAYGFRNPWRFTFHPATADVYLADVGNDRWEEIDVVVRGGDHGWPSREGFECQSLPDAPGLVDEACEDRDTVLPLWAYGHLAIDAGGGQAVAGGTVVRDPDLPELQGAYLFADFVVGRLWAIAPGETAVLLLDTDMAITEVAEGPAGEVLLVGIEGTLARLVEAP